MFIDEVTMEVTAGRGGDGCMAFLREKFVPMGGPNGGNGGKGADIIFKADEGLKTLIDLRYLKNVKGDPGLNGEGKNKNGKYAIDKIIKVPVGTTIKDQDTGLVIADLTKQGEEVIVAYGGKGGRGNVTLATRSNPCPSFAERGEPGEVRKIKVELRMIADVGLVGMPSVGKSTLLSMITNANPKIASYHFTTLSPNLGVVTTKDKFTYVIADLPGLIEGASEGTGLGHKFLKHIERTKIIAHIIDISSSEGRDPYNDYQIIRKELENFSPKLLNKQEVIIANKIDLPNAKENLEIFKKKVNKDVYGISALNNQNLDTIINILAQLVKDTKEEILYDEDIQESHVLYKFKKEKPFTIIKENNSFIIKGEQVEKIFKMINFNTEESISRFAKKLRKMGVDEELEKLGVKEGDIIKILDYEFEYTK
ncbi:MAG: GTPase ObgE [Mycoplasmatota bacterium]|nr:GTPase ObgE [Mycoplasmatota bacterium]